MTGRLAKAEATIASPGSLLTRAISIKNIAGFVGRFQFSHLVFDLNKPVFHTDLTVAGKAVSFVLLPHCYDISEESSHH